MKRQKIPVGLLRAGDQFGVKAMEGIGTPALAKGFLEAAQMRIPCSHCTVFALEDIGLATALSFASQYGDAAEVTAQLYIERGFYRRDVNMRWLASKKTPQREQVWLLHQTADDITDAEYRRLCYTDNGIRERLSLTYLLVDGRRMTVSFYRSLSLPSFDPADFDTAMSMAPIVGAALKAHIRATRRHLRGSLLHQEIFSKLSNRERQVISYILAGRTMKEAAELMKLSATTVQTYRYRAFRSLGIRSHRDLLALLDRSPATL